MSPLASRGPLRVRRKNASRKQPDPTLAEDAPCWCGSGRAYADCHRLYDQIYSLPRGKVDPALCPS